jgi:hypothetical protein
MRTATPISDCVLEPRDRIGLCATPTPKCSGSFYRARYYDPAAGRFLSEDLFQPGNGLNRYLYAQNKPTNLTDPTGEIVVNAGAALAGAGIGAVVGAIGAAITPGATLTSVAVGTGAGALVGATAGFTFGTSLAMNAFGGAVVGAAGDVLGQAATNLANGNPAFDRISGESATIGAIAGAVSFGGAARALRGRASDVDAALVGAALAAGVDLGLRTSARQAQAAAQQAQAATPCSPPPLGRRK